MRNILLAGVLAFSLFGVEGEWRFENSNFIYNSKGFADNEPYTYDFNRFRVTGDLYAGDFSFKMIADNETFIGPGYLDTAEYGYVKEYDADVPFDTRTDPATREEAADRLKLYRLYGEYIKGRHYVTAGLMRAAFGVGRIWTPVDFFNPLNSLSIETDEREGVFGTMYEYALSDLSVIQFVVAENRNETTKKAVRLKGYLEFADVALLGYDSEAMQFTGYELDAKVGETDFAFRSEGGSYTDKVLDTTYTKYILGADYGFANSLTILVEYLYNGLKADPLTGLDVNSHREHNYLGTILGYQPNPLWMLNFTAIRNLDDKSSFLSPNAVYSLSDESDLTVGMTGFGGDEESEFGAYPDTYYLRWYRHF